LFVVLLWASVLGAQVITGAIVGTVRDEGGGLLEGAEVTISSPALLGGTPAFITNEKGQFRFPALAPGIYSLTVVLPGFQTWNEEGLRVLVGGTLESAVVLKIAAITEAVTVTGESPLIDPKKSGLSTNYGTEQQGNIPLRARASSISSSPLQESRPPGPATCSARGYPRSAPARIVQPQLRQARALHRSAPRHDWGQARVLTRS
jgi:hypothetical protein